MQGRKEIAKAWAKVVPLDKAYDYDSAVVQHDGGKATVSEIRFAGKKYSLALGANEKAEMSAGQGSNGLYFGKKASKGAPCPFGKAA